MVAIRRSVAAALLALSAGLPAAPGASAAGYVPQAAGGPPVRVCLIDTGVPENTPGVVERLTATGSLEPGGPHGVQMASIIRTAYSSAQVVSVQKVDGRATATTVADVINLCVSRATPVILMAFSLAPSPRGYDRPALQRAVDRARAAGVVLVAAAGNDGRVEAPAKIAGVIGVGAVGADGDPCAFSASGRGLVMAPGCAVDGTDTDGTSDAAAYVAGSAAALAGTRGLSGDALERAVRTARYGLSGSATDAGDGDAADARDDAYLWIARRARTRVVVTMHGRRASTPAVRVRGRAVTGRPVVARRTGRRLLVMVRCPGRAAVSLQPPTPRVGSGHAVLLPPCDT